MPRRGVPRRAVRARACPGACVDRADARRSEHQSVLGAGDEATGRELAHEPLIERQLELEVKLLERLHCRDVGDLDPHRDALFRGSAIRALARVTCRRVHAARRALPRKHRSCPGAYAEPCDVLFRESALRARARVPREARLTRHLAFEERRVDEARRVSRTNNKSRVRIGVVRAERWRSTRVPARGVGARSAASRSTRRTLVVRPRACAATNVLRRSRSRTEQRARQFVLARRCGAAICPSPDGDGRAA